MVETNRVQLMTYGLGWTGFWIGLALILSTMIWGAHNSDDRESKDLISHRDTCTRLVQYYDSQISYTVGDFNYCMGKAR